MTEHNDRCPCGRPSPCDDHDVTPGMRDAMAALQALNARQRARVLCWFCSECAEYVPPGRTCEH